MSHPKSIYRLLVVGHLLLPLVAGADTTGQLRGSVVDEHGAPLTGVSVSASSPAQIGGEQLGSTDARGEFRFPLLAPGDYVVRLTLDGHVTQELTEVRVRLERTTQLQVTMAKATFADEIVVAETTPVVDPEQTSAGQVFTAEYLEKATIGTKGRSYLAVPEQVAGVLRAGYSYRVYGSRSWENSFQLDGVSIAGSWDSGPLFDGIGFDAIQEVAVHTAGFGAEYGLASGGVVNAITKSGGNRFQGSLDLRYRDNGFDEAGEHYDPDTDPYERGTLAAALGGPVLRDRLWFFVSGNDWFESVTPFETPYSRDTSTRILLGKLTWQASPGWSLVGRYLAEDGAADRVGGDRYTAEEATARIDYEVGSASLDLTGILSDTLIWSLQLGDLDTTWDEAPFTGDFSSIGHLNAFTGETYGNQFRQFYNDWGNQEVRTDLSWFVPAAHGSHETKAGLRYAQLDFGRDTCRNGSGRVCTAGDVGFAFVDAFDFSTGENLPFIMRTITALGREGVDGVEQSVYVQDSWRPRADLTVHLGLRWDQSRQRHDFGGQEVEFDELQPRLGVAWDVGGDGRNLLRASWGRYLNPTTLALGDLFLGEGTWGEEYWFSCSLPAELRDLPVVPAELHDLLGLTDPQACAAAADSAGFSYRTEPEAWDPAGWVAGYVVNAEGGRLAPDLDPMTVDHLVLAFERELFRRTSLELGFIYKDFNDIQEDTCSQNYPEPIPSAGCPGLIMANLPEARRDYQAWTLRFESRALDRFQVNASWIWAESKGSVDGFVNGFDFDHFPLQYDNRYGYLPDNGHRVKINGFVDLPWDLLLAVGGYWSSEIRWTPIDTTREFDGPIFIEPRGNRKEDGLYNLDLQLSKGFRLGRTQIQLIGTVYNALDSQRPTDFCSHVTFCRERLGEPEGFQQPRSYEMGLRIDF